MIENPNLIKLRSEIEQLTLEIIHLTGKRSSLAEKVMREKLTAGATLVNRGVERHLRNRVIEQCENEKQDSNFALRLLNQLITESVRIQRTHLKPTEAVNAYHVFVKAKALEKAGGKVIHLEVGEPDFGPPVEVAETLTKAVKDGHAGYTQSAGILELRTKIADHVNRIHKLDISAEQVTVTVGGRFAIYLDLVTSLRPGEEVVIFNPSYPAYSDCVRQVGGRPIHVSTSLDDKWIPNIGHLEDSINKTTRMIILNSPSNPTGKILSKSILSEIVELAIESDIQILSDEVYSEFAFSPHSSILQFPECNQVYVNSFSKTFGMTGFRLGYAISDVDTIQRMTKLQTLSLTCAPEFIQHAGVKAFDCKSEASQYTGIIEKRQKKVSNLLEKLPVSFLRPDGGFYIFPMLNNENETGLQFADKLLSEKGVAVVPGTGYGSEYFRFFRISVCQPVEQLIKAVTKIEEVLG
ncbi:MAG: aminotransferase class I/II-fold pyridoxal phosphate-dependent enzyme [Candidatus Thorarchaeota archaeon]|jgi:aspartate aminotransferase